jgi:hypothetical protein
MRVLCIFHQTCRVLEYVSSEGNDMQPCEDFGVSLAAELAVDRARRPFLDSEYESMFFRYAHYFKTDIDEQF